MKKRGVAFLAFLYFSYLLVGAAIFWEIEFGHEEVLCRQTIAELQEYNITNTTEEGNITIADLRNLVEVSYQQFIYVVTNQYQQINYKNTLFIE